jgi:hypothetical protein
MARPQFDALLVVWWVSSVGPLLTPSVKFRLVDRFCHQITLKKPSMKSFFTSHKWNNSSNSLHLVQCKQFYSSSKPTNQPANRCTIMSKLVSLELFYTLRIQTWCNAKCKTRGASHFGLAIYIKKYLQRQKKELWKLKYIYFTMQKI